MTTSEILDRLKDEYSLTSDYQVAKKLNISRSRVSHYRVSNQTMSDELVLKVEKLLEVPEGTLLLEMQASRTKCPEAAEVLHRISKQILSAAASILLVITMAFGIYPDNAIAKNLTNNFRSNKDQ